MGLENPLNYIFDNPKNPLEKAKSAIGDAAQGALDSSFGKGVLSAAEKVLEPLNFIAKPYRDWAAPKLTSALLMANSQYRDKNKNLSFIEQFYKGQDLAREKVQGESEWRRSVSPGRALVGLVGNWTPGQQGVDKLDWENSKQVNDFFSSGSAQFFSGISDVGFNILDPVAAVAAKGTSYVRKGFIERPMTGKGAVFTKPETLHLELQDAVTNPGQKTAAEEIFKLIEKNPEDVTTISNYGFVRHSTDPARLATAISTAYTLGGETAGRQNVADVISAALGHKPSYDKIMAQSEELHQQLKSLNGTTDKVSKDLSELKQIVIGKDDVDGVKLSAKIAAEKAYQKQLNALDKQVAEVQKSLVPAQFVSSREGSISSTWSKFASIERVRVAAAEANTKGLIVDVTPSKGFSFAKEVANSDAVKGIPKPVIRYLTWLSPDTQVREAPAGIAFLGGAGGDRSYIEVDARIRRIAKLAKLDIATQNKLRNEYRTLISKSDRNFFLEKLQEDSVKWLLQKHYGEAIDKMNKNQLESMQTFARALIDDTRRAQAREVEKALDKNYTVVDGLSGDYVSHAYLNDLVEKSALERALTRGESVAKDSDRTAVREAMKQNPLFETQVPNIHFSYDFKLWDQIMSENPQLLGNMVRGIVEENWTPAKVRSEMKDAQNSAINGTTGLGQGLKSNAKLMVDVVQEGLDGFYTYLWKPVTLMSLKYTSRNVGEGWLRTIAAMADYSVNNGYSWTDMFKSAILPDKGVFDRTVNNRIYRKKLKASSKQFDSLNKQMLKTESDIRKQLGPLTEPSKNALNSYRLKMDDDVRLELFKSKDGVTMCIEWMRRPFEKLNTYKGIKNPQADKTATFLRDVVGKEVFTPNVQPGAAGDFVTALATGDYKLAQTIADNANSTTIAQALSDYGLVVKKALEDIDVLQETGAATVDNAIRASKFGLERLAHHIDLTNSLLIKRGGLRDELLDISKKSAVGGKIVKSYTKKDHVEIYPGVFIDQSLAGRHDDMLRNATSSRASTTGVLSDDRRLTAHGFLTSGFARRIVSRAEKDWANAHADYVNNVIMRDAASRRMVTDLANGLSEKEAVDNAVAWVAGGSDEALRWKSEVRQNIVNRGEAMSSEFYSTTNLINEALFQIAQHLPKYNAETGAEYIGLHQKALDGLSVGDSLNLSYSNRHDVMATKEIENFRIDNLYRNTVSKIFNFVGTMPEDHLVRHPFFNMVHDNEAKSIAKRIAEQGRNQGMSDKEINAWILSRRDAIKETATNRAYKELMTKLYSVERYTDPGRFMRFLTPFYMAHQNSSRFWLGQTLRNPQIAVFLAKAYNAPYRSGYVYDQQGELVSAGHPWESDSSTDQMIFGLPKILRDYTGKESIRTSPNGLDVITQGQYPVLPTLGGPVIQPVLTGALQKAAQQDGLSKFIEKTTGMTFDEFTNHFIMPFYSRQEATSIAGSIASNIVPLNSWMKSSLAAVSGGNFPLASVRNVWNTRYEEAVKQVYEENLLNGQKVDPEQVRNKATIIARKSLAFEAISSAVGPVAAFKTDSEVLRQLKGRQQALIASLGYNEGNVAFVQELENLGIENAAGMVSVLNSSSTDNRYGFIANSATISGINSNIGSLSQVDIYYPDNPFVGELFNRTDSNINNRNTILGDAMYSISINGKPLKSRNMSPVEIERQRQIRAGWADYFNYVDFINASAKKDGVEIGSTQYQKFYAPQKATVEEFVAKKYPVWGARENRITLHKSDAFIALADRFVNDKQFMKTVGKNNEAIRGLKMYMDLRKTIVDEFQANIDATGYTTLDADVNERFGLLRDYAASLTIAKYKGFGQMYERYLSEDELRPIPTTFSEAGN